MICLINLFIVSIIIYKRLWSEATSKTESEQDYDRYEHEGITIYIHKLLIISDKIEIDLKSNIPLFGPTFSVNGIST